MQVTDHVTKHDLKKLEASLQAVLKATKKSKLEPAHLDLLNKIVDAVNDLRLVVEFDHEERLRALEDYLSGR